MENLNLKPATTEDLAFVLNVQERAMSPSTIMVHGYWDHELQKKNTNESNISTYELISVNNKNVGALQVFDNEDHYEFSRIYILPEEQSKGFGSLAIKEVARRAWAKGKLKILFKVHKVNQSAIDLYKRLGGRIIEELEVHYLMIYELDSE